MMFDAKEQDTDPRDDPSSARDECTASFTPDRLRSGSATASLANLILEMYYPGGPRRDPRQQAMNFRATSVNFLTAVAIRERWEVAG